MNSTLVHFSGKNPKDLKLISRDEYALVHIKRELTWIDPLKEDLLSGSIDLCITGSRDQLINQLKQEFSISKFPLLMQDIIDCLNYIDLIINSTRYRLQLSTVTTDMCRKFHTDICDLRLLCTYLGKGTLWIGDSDFDHTTLKGNEDLDQELIFQAEEGDLLLFKGALYPSDASNPAVHMSPPIQHTHEKRLLLRIDTDSFLTIINQ